jgi:NTP pyrophosphatase (non-canonical NTP hydrolase)
MNLFELFYKCPKCSRLYKSGQVDRWIKLEIPEKQTDNETHIFCVSPECRTVALVPFTKVGALDAYQSIAKTTAVFPDKHGLLYLTLGLCGEAGEVAELMKKAVRDEDSFISDARRESLKKELGDVLWYLSILSAKLGYSLSEVAQSNIEKLLDRKDRGVIKGDGNER